MKRDFKKLWVLVSILTISGVLVGTHEVVSAYTRNQSNITLADAQFAPLNGTTNYQIKLNVNYSVSYPTLFGQKLNAVMKDHSSNGKVIKTTSYPLGFTANNTGTIQLLTNIPIAVVRNITTETFLTDLNKTNILSNPVKTLPTIALPIKSSEFTPTVIKNKT
jgi:outer membrane phospholipase A